MANNHLIIGLGGTGGNIIRAFRKTIYQTYSSNEAPNVNLRYLYVDSDDEFMKPNDPSWKILGQSVELDQTSKMLIQGMNLRDVVDNLSQYPGLRPWLGSRQDWSEILGASNAAGVVGGQKRRLGRFLFAIHASEFREQVRSFVQEMQRSTHIPAKTPTDIHICCGLAGGTGSGAVIDALCHIRSACPDKEIRILLYALLPERDPQGNRAGPNYHANGYAALMELNALRIGSWSPHDTLSADGSRFHDLQDVYDACYLFNDENEAKVPVSLNQLFEITSSFLFQKIVQADVITWENGNTIQRHESFQVGGQGIEPELSARLTPRRSRYFFSFGVKQIAYPNLEIAEYLTYSFAQQCVRQLMFNRWVEGEGYRDEEMHQSHNEDVLDKGKLEAWLLTDEHLTLSTGIVATETKNKNWKPIPDYWNNLIPNYKTLVLEDYKSNYVKMLPELTKLAETAFQEQYRGSGVPSFYETKRKDMGDHVRELRSKIEGDLFSQWRDGEKSVHDIDRILEALIGSLRARNAIIDGNIARVGVDSEAYTQNEARIKDIREQWAKLGPLSVGFGKHKKLLGAQELALSTRYTLKTRVEGWRYAHDLVQRLIQELDTLAADVSLCRKTIADAAKKFSDSLASRLRDGEGSDLSQQTVRKFNPVEVRKFVQKLVGSGTQQKRQTAAARKALFDQFKERQSFTSFAHNIGLAELSDVLEKSCKVQAEASHAAVIAEDKDLGKILNVSVIDLLRRQYDGNDDGLRDFSVNIMNMASNYLKFDQSEVKLAEKGIPAYNNPENKVGATGVSIIMPPPEGSPTFRNKLLAALKASYPGHSPYRTIDGAINPTRPHEITILSVTNIFPARFVSVVKYLKSRYEARLKGSDPKRAFLELHCEGDSTTLGSGQVFYDLYAESYKPADILPWVLLADAMGLLIRGKDLDTGRDKIQVTTLNQNKMKVPFDLGPTLESVIEEASPAVIEELRNIVERALEGDYLRIEKRREVENALRAQAEETGRKLTYDSPRYKEQVVAFATIQKLLQVGD